MRKFLLDSFFCFLMIFGLMGLFASVTAFRVFDLFDPIGEMFSDFDITDLVMSQLRETPPASEDIVLVNISLLNREGLARQIDIISQYNPAVIGVDAYLEGYRSFSEDSLLIEVLERTPNVIFGDKLLNFDESKKEFDSLLRPEPRVADLTRFGYANLLTDAANQDDLKSCREFLPSQMVNGEKQMAFGVKLVSEIAPMKAEKFLQRNNEIEAINYKGNAMDFGQTTFGTRYFVLDVKDVFEGNFSEDLFQDKVVIMCFMGKELGDQETRIDRYFTPLNKNYVGKSEPDMWGGVIHANIVSMILEEDYIDTMSHRTSIMLAILICCFNVLLFKFIYGAIPRWYDGVTKLIQLAQVLLLSALMIALFDWYTYKVDFTIALIVIALSGDSIEVYHGVVKNLFDKKNRKELFKVNWQFLKDH